MGPALQGIFVGQGPRALPGVRGKTGQRGEGTLPYGDVAGKCLRGIPQSASLTAPKGTGVTDCHDQCAHWSRNDRLQGMPWAGRCGERTERCRWQIQRGERVAAVKISSVRRKAARKFWAPQQDHRPLRRCGREVPARRGGRTHGSRPTSANTLFIHVQDK